MYTLTTAQMWNLVGNSACIGLMLGWLGGTLVTLAIYRAIRSLHA